jgi:Protein of unknown function (DUF1501)
MIRNQSPMDFPMHRTQTCRRTFLRQSGLSLGALALAALGGPGAARAAVGPAARRGLLGGQLHVPARAKRVIHLCMAGGPSHLETFDHKPILKALHGRPFPESFTKGQQLAQLQGAKLMARGPFIDFKKCGASGTEISNLFPHLQALADELCIVRSMHTEQINHDPAHAFFNTGSIIKGRPSMGSWLLYGLGAETDSLPGYVVMISNGPGVDQPISARQWSSGFLPSQHQGVALQTKGSPVHYVGRPEGVSLATQRDVIDEINTLNSLHHGQTGDPEILTRISQYELAFKMQTSVPDLADMANEPQHILDMYGVKTPGDGSFASNALMARRLAERGVRFIQLYHRGWDHHGDIETKMPTAARLTDQASAALIRDLKQRGLLDDTLIIWGGEFGRTPMGQGTGRDHHINAFSIALCGGGIKPGTTWGSTDELGYRFLEDGQQVHVHDLHATMLHLCGIDHMRLSHKFQGLDLRLTGVEPASVIGGILA